MPKIHPLTGNIACGTAGVHISVKIGEGEPKRLVDGGNSHWLDENHIAYLGPPSGSWGGVAGAMVPMKVNIHTGQFVVLDAREASFLTASRGRWQAGQAGQGNTFGTLGEFPGATLSRAMTDSRGAAGPDGTIAQVDSYQQARNGFRLYRPDGSVTDRIADGFDAYHLTVVSARAAIWPMRDRWGVFGLPEPKWLPGSLRTCWCEVGNDVYLVHEINGVGLVARQKDSTRGKILVRGNAYHYDAIAWQGGVRFAFTVTDGEPLGSLVSGFWDLSTDVDLAQVSEPIEPVNRAMWCGGYEFDLASPSGMGNASILVVQGAPFLYVKDRQGRNIYTYAAGASDGVPDEIRAAVRRTKEAEPNLPCIAYIPYSMERRQYVIEPGGDIGGAEVFGLEGYAKTNETLAQFEARYRDGARRAGRHVGIGQGYTSNTNNHSELKPLVPIFARCARDFSNQEGLFVFSAKGRQTGLQDHPDARALWMEVFASIREPRSEPTPGPTPPQPPQPPQPQPPAPTPGENMIANYSEYFNRRWAELRVKERSDALLQQLGLTPEQADKIFDTGGEEGDALEKKFQAIQCPALFQIAGELFHTQGKKDVGLSQKLSGNNFNGRATDIFAIKPTNSAGRVIGGPDFLVDVLVAGGSHRSSPTWNVLGPNNDPSRKWIEPPTPGNVPAPGPTPPGPTPPSPGNVNVSDKEVQAMAKRAIEEYAKGSLGQDQARNLGNVDHVMPSATVWHLAFRFFTGRYTAEQVIDDARRRGNGDVPD